MYCKNCKTTLKKQQKLDNFFLGLKMVFDRRKYHNNDNEEKNHFFFIVKHQEQRNS